MKDKFLKGLQKSQLRKIALELKIEKSNKMNIASLLDALKGYSYNKLIESLNK